MNADDALAALRTRGDAARAEGMAAYHKVPREYLGLRVTEVDLLVRGWRREMSPDGQVALAAALWDSDIHEARIAAARLIAPARLGQAEPAAWAHLCRWAEGFDGWALADHACIAGHRRVTADRSRIETVARWITHDNMWTRRAALVITLPWARLAAPDAEDRQIREHVLGWAAEIARDSGWFAQKAVGWWLRELSLRDPARVHAFLAVHGARMQPFARREATRRMR